MPKKEASMQEKLAPKIKKTKPRPRLQKKVNLRTKKMEEAEVAVIVAEIITAITVITVTALKTITAAVVQYVFPRRRRQDHHQRHRHLLQQLRRHPKQRELQQQSPQHHHRHLANDQFVNVFLSVLQSELISHPSQEF